LFENGIMLKDGAALERLAEIDTVVFDKTGVLTRGQPSLIHNQAADEKSFQLAAAIAAHSRHPYSRALATAGGQSSARRIALEDITEHPGLGLEAYIGHHVYRLGRADWALETSEWSLSKDREANVTLSKDRRFLASFGFDDDLRADVREALASLNTKGISVEIVSGDRITPVRDLALVLSIPYAAEVLPGDKAARVATINASEHKALMIGDGLNDAPALAAAHASMAPATAADIGRNAADFVFLRESLLAVPQAITIARNAARLVRQNLVLAIGYNAIAVPLAVLGYATPLIAAVAMSLSSLIVMTNALRLKGNQEARRFPNPITAARDVPPSAAVARG
jgi:Cu2+-exporting ATPase